MRLLSSVLACRSAGVAVAIAVAVLCAPGRAAATCGDYLHVGGDQPAADVNKPAGDHGSQHQQNTPRPPCDGPSCSGKSGTPVAPLSAPVTDPGASKQWAARGGAEADGGGGTRWSAPISSDSSPIHVPGSIFHPPRAA